MDQNPKNPTHHQAELYHLETFRCRHLLLDYDLLSSIRRYPHILHDSGGLGKLDSSEMQQFFLVDP
jgi:hypothetical protein